MASQITGVTIVCSVCSEADERKHQSSASLAFVKGKHRWPVDAPHKGPVTRKMFPFDDVIIWSIIKLEIATHFLFHPVLINNFTVVGFSNPCNLIKKNCLLSEKPEIHFKGKITCHWSVDIFQFSYIICAHREARVAPGVRRWEIIFSFQRGQTTVMASRITGQPRVRRNSLFRLTTKKHQRSAWLSLCEVIPRTKGK